MNGTRKFSRSRVEQRRMRVQAADTVLQPRARFSRPETLTMDTTSDDDYDIGSEHWFRAVQPTLPESDPNDGNA